MTAQHCFALTPGEPAGIGPDLCLLLAREANVVVRDTTFAQDLQASLSEAIYTGATRVDAHTFAHRPWWQQLVDWGASLVLRFGVFLTGKRY